MNGLAGIAALGPGSLGTILDLLAQAFPYPAFLLDSIGRLRWMSDPGAMRLGIPADVSAGRTDHRNAAVEALARHARALAREHAADVERGLRSGGFLRGSERLVSRRFGEVGCQLLLLALAPAMADLPGQDRREGEARLPGLGTAESRVARLAAEGYSVLNISARLGVSEATVKTHLHRVYVKLGIHGRAALACTLLRGA